MTINHAIAFVAGLMFGFIGIKLFLDCRKKLSHIDKEIAKLKNIMGDKS